ncbi:MAG: DsbA family protein [Chloroflexota bacterium]
MAKVTPRRKKRAQRRNTNWLVIGGIVLLGVVALFALLFTTLQGPQEPATTSLVEFCAENDENCVEKGEPDAPVTVVEISDYACIHCRNFNVEGPADDLEAEYVETGQVRWVVLPYSSNSMTEPAAEAAFCVAEQGVFFEYQREMFARFGTDGAYSSDSIRSAAETAGADLEAFDACLSNSANADLLQQNRTASLDAGVTATPTFFVNGEKVEGNAPQEIRRHIDSVLGS